MQEKNFMLHSEHGILLNAKESLLDHKKTLFRHIQPCLMQVRCELA
jgi:hypothetical protein